MNTRVYTQDADYRLKFIWMDHIIFGLKNQLRPISYFPLNFGILFMYKVQMTLDIFQVNFYVF